nr:unnamed protein product [Callosobruchus analis]
MQIHKGFARPLRAGFLSGTLGVVSLLALSLAMASAKHTQLEAVVKGNTGFTSKLYQALAQKEGNVFFSPISVHAVLSMLQQGAKGKTQEVLGEVLGVPLLTESAEGYQHLMKSLIAINGHVELNLANKIYIQEKYGFQDNFALTMSQNFLSDVQALDFAKGEDARQTINSWVEEKTKNKIKDLIPENSLGSDTRLVLVNAIYFKGKWKYTFNASDTKTEKFYLDDDENSVDVQMMHLKQRLFYKEDENLDAKVLELPYDSNIEDLSLVIILPNKRDGIAELEDKLATVDLSTITDNMQKPEVFVSLPKFKIESSMDLKDPLKEIGLGDLFTESADLSGIIKSGEGLKVSKAIQKAFIEVNEEGTEAAAATGMSVRLKRSTTFQEEFIADHPFIVSLVLRDLCEIFVGRINKPTPAYSAHDEFRLTEEHKMIACSICKKGFFHQCVELTTSELRTIKQKKKSIVSFLDFIGFSQYNHILNSSQRLLDLIVSDKVIHVRRDDLPLVAEDTYHPALEIAEIIYLIGLKDRYRKLYKRDTQQKPKNLSFVGVHIKMRTARIRPPTGFLADHPFLAMVWVMISARCMPPPPEDFIADHPFIAVLQMKQNEPIVEPKMAPGMEPPDFVADHPFVVVLQATEDNLKKILFQGRLASEILMAIKTEQFVADHPFVVLLQATEDNLKKILFEGRVQMVLMSLQRREVFVADHPFIVLLQATKENLSTILFQGRIEKP